MRSLRESIPFAALVHLLCPGLGHVFWKEYVFGLFVFLIMLIASLLFFVSFLLTIPQTVVWLLLGLPTVFYAFSFFDLAKSVKNRRSRTSHTGTSAVLFIVVAVAYQFLAPNAPVNFLLRNMPEIYVMDNHRLQPLYKQGSLMSTSRLAYSVDLFFFDYPLYHTLPEHFDLVQFKDSLDHRNVGVVLGVSGESVEIIDGELAIDSHPTYPPRATPLIITGDWPLTTVPDNSILVATLNLGQIDSVREVPLHSLVGKVDRLF